MISAVTIDDADHYRQFESSRPGTSGIEQQDTVDDLIAWLVTVAAHNDVRVFAQEFVAKDVRQQNSPSADGDPRDLVAIIVVVIASNKVDRRDLAKGIEHMFAADVAGVKDDVDALQRRERLRANEAMGVGDDPDTRRAACSEQRAGGGPLAARRSLLATSRYSLSSPRWNSGIAP